jgi:hypothetical protein
MVSEWQSYALKHNDGVMVNIERLASNRKAIESPTPHASTDTLLNQVCFEFCDATDDGEEQPAHCTIRGDVLSSRHELDAEAVKLIHDTEEVLRTVRQAGQ